MLKVFCRLGLYLQPAPAIRPGGRPSFHMSLSHLAFHIAPFAQRLRLLLTRVARCFSFRGLVELDAI